MRLILIINSFVCAAGTVLGALFAGGSIISIATMTVPWRELLIVAALLVPVAFLVSAIGSWLAYKQGFTQVTVGLVALPWVYAVVFIILMLVSFE